MVVLAAGFSAILSLGCGPTGPSATNAPPPTQAEGTNSPETNAMESALEMPENREEGRGGMAADSGVPSDQGDDQAPSVAVDVAPWEEILAKAKSSGKPTVVDVWSLACEPCMKEFPGLVALHKQYGEALACISVNVDFDGRRTHPPEGYSTNVKRFLSFNDAQFDNYICSTANDLVFEALDIPSIPAVLLLDSEGNEVARFVDVGETRGFTYEKNIAPAVADLLNQTSPNQPAQNQTEQNQ